MLQDGKLADVGNVPNHNDERRHIFDALLRPCFRVIKLRLIQSRAQTMSLLKKCLL